MVVEQVVGLTDVTWRIFEQNEDEGRMRDFWEVREGNGVHAMDVQFDDDTLDVITLDAGDGCNVWPRVRWAGENSKLLSKVWGWNGGGEWYVY